MTQTLLPDGSPIQTVTIEKAKDDGSVICTVDFDFEIAVGEPAEHKAEIADFLTQSFPSLPIGLMRREDVVDLGLCAAFSQMRITEIELTGPAADDVRAAFAMVMFCNPYLKWQAVSWSLDSEYDAASCDTALQAIMTEVAAVGGSISTSALSGQ